MKIVSNGKTLEVPSCASQDIYSTEEQVVGRWIDGKPIYRRFLSSTVPSAAYNSDGGVVIPGIGTIDDVDIIVNFSFSLYKNTFVLTFLQESLILLKWDKSVNTLRISLASEYNIGARLNVIIEYTKTTDQATIELPTALTAAPAKALYKAALQSAATVTLDAGIKNEEV